MKYLVCRTADIKVEEETTSNEGFRFNEMVTKKAIVIEREFDYITDAEEWIKEQAKGWSKWNENNPFIIPVMIDVEVNR